MGTRTVKLVDCDRCHSTEGVERREIRLPQLGKKGRYFSFDACEECRTSVPLSEWETLLMPKRPRGVVPGVVVSEAEVAAAGRGRRVVKR